MSSYSLVRGWVECAFEDVSKIREIVYAHWQSAVDYGIEKSSADLYLKGWHFPETPMNWTSLIFYGGNVRDVAVSFLKECFMKLSDSGIDVDGIFYVDDEEGENLRVWTLSAQGVFESSRD